jgi:hypothetical protein
MPIATMLKAAGAGAVMLGCILLPAGGSVPGPDPGVSEERAAPPAAVSAPPAAVSAPPTVAASISTAAREAPGLLLLPAFVPPATVPFLFPGREEEAAEAGSLSPPADEEASERAMPGGAGAGAGEEPADAEDAQGAASPTEDADAEDAQGAALDSGPAEGGAPEEAPDVLQALRAVGEFQGLLHAAPFPSSVREEEGRAGTRREEPPADPAAELLRSRADEMAESEEWRDRPEPLEPDWDGQRSEPREDPRDLDRGLELLFRTPATSRVDLLDELRKRSSIFIYGGFSTMNDLSEIATMQISADERALIGVGLSFDILRLGESAWWPRWEGEINIGWHFESGEQDDFIEYNVVPFIARWDRFPWQETIRTSLAIGEGLSYAAQVPSVERERQDDDVNHFLNYLFFEASGAHPSWERTSFFFRLHHRSGAWGLFDGADGGSNLLVFGVRYSLR